MSENSGTAVNRDLVLQNRTARAEIIAKHPSLNAAISSGELGERIDSSLSELIVLGLLRQNVRTFFTVFGHGSTELGEVLRIYEQYSLVRTFGVRSEVEASHAATALNWATGEKAAVVTSIGPGALHGLAASLVPASNGIGVWYLMGDETSEDEGFNMQQIPKHDQNLYLRLMDTLGKAYSLSTPLAISTALRRGLNTTSHPYKAGPFFLLMPMNKQPEIVENFNLRELPSGIPAEWGSASGDYKKAIEWITEARKIVVKIGGGARKCGPEIKDFLEKIGGVTVLTPPAVGAFPYENPRCMGVGGSKGSLCGNYAMEEADLLIAIGTRAVCQSDCSRTGYPSVQHVININASLDDATHYQDTLAFVGDAKKTLIEFNKTLQGHSAKILRNKTAWLGDCLDKKKVWEIFKNKRFDQPILFDPFWKKPVLTQPAAIQVALKWAKGKDVLSFFDAGDVQANGFQLAEESSPGKMFTDTGASYMGFAVSAILASAAIDSSPYFLAFTGDGSFTMNPQILIDGPEHNVRGCILLLDNNRMAAISGLQKAQYGFDFATWTKEPIDYLGWAKCFPGVLGLDGGSSPAELLNVLEKAYDHEGLSLIHLPVYYGDNPLGGLGVYGRWNVGNWVADTQELRHQIGL